MNFFKTAVFLSGKEYSSDVDSKVLPPMFPLCNYEEQEWML
jgi:hypothetical protein